MNRVALSEVDSDLRGEIERRRLSEPLETTTITLNHYRIPPGGGLPGGLHAHMDQEELFFVVRGAATFETFEGEITVEADSAIRFEPGEFQSGRNATEEWLVVLAIGAPRESEDVRIPFGCPACGHEDLRLSTDGELAFVCPVCSHTQIPETVCPACGQGDLRVTLDGDHQPMVACSACDAEFESPPLGE